MKHLALLFTFFLFVSCNLKNEAVDANKQEQEQEIIPANAISPQTADPAKILLKAKLSLPANLKEKPLPSDLVIWSLINSEGAVVAGAVEQLPAFPWQFQVQVKNLMQPISPETRLLLSIRIVHNGEETMPPQKGQLEVMLGSTSSEPEPAVGKAGISSKILAKIEKKLKEQIDASRDLSIGDSVEGNFQPSENSF